MREATVAALRRVHEQAGQVGVADLRALASDPATALGRVLVRCEEGQVSVAARDCEALMACVERGGWRLRRVEGRHAVSVVPTSVLADAAEAVASGAVGAAELVLELR